MVGDPDRPPPAKRNKSDQDEDRNHDNRGTPAQDASIQSKKNVKEGSKQVVCWSAPSKMDTTNKASSKVMGDA